MAVKTSKDMAMNRPPKLGEDKPSPLQWTGFASRSMRKAPILLSTKVYTKWGAYSSQGLPHLHGVVNAGGGEARTIRRAGYSDYIATVTEVGAKGVSCNGVPNLHGLIVATGGDTPAVWRPGYSIHAKGRITIDKA